MTRTRSPIAFAASLLLLLAAGRRLAAQEQTQKFQGEIQVREVGLVVEPLESGPFHTQDLLVFEGGKPRPVVKAEPLRPADGNRPWSLVLYFDRVLAAPETAHGAALALARQARGLTALGPVEIAVADPEPRVALAATTDAAGVSDALAHIAETAQPTAPAAKSGDRKPAQPAAKSAARTDVATLRRQLDRLAVFLAGRPGGDARALFLVVDGFAPPPGEADLLSAPDVGEPVPPGTAAAALRETSRFLAAAGWVTFAMPFRDAPPSPPVSGLSDIDRIRVSADSSRHTNSAPPVMVMQPADRGPLRHESVIEVFTRPEATSLQALVQPTAGTLLGVDEQIRPAVDGLARRWRVWYQAPEPLDGKRRLVEVRLPNSRDPLRGQRWIEISTPEELDAARARLLAAGAQPAGGTIAVDARVEGGKLHLRVPGAGTPDAAALRLSVAFDNRSEVRHLVLPEVRREKGWEHALDLRPPAGARRAAVVVDDLSRGTWGGAAIELR